MIISDQTLVLLCLSRRVGHGVPEVVMVPPLKRRMAICLSDVSIAWDKMWRTNLDASLTFRICLWLLRWRLRRAGRTAVEPLTQRKHFSRLYKYRWLIHSYSLNIDPLASFLVDHVVEWISLLQYAVSESVTVIDISPLVHRRTSLWEIDQYLCQNLAVLLLQPAYFVCAMFPQDCDLRIGPWPQLVVFWNYFIIA